MTNEELETVQNIVCAEGFFYGIVFYSDFKNEVKDPKFHELRDKMLAASRELATYCEVEHDQ